MYRLIAICAGIWTLLFIGSLFGAIYGGIRYTEENNKIRVLECNVTDCSVSNYTSRSWGYYVFKLNITAEGLQSELSRIWPYPVNSTYSCVNTPFNSSNIECYRYYDDLSPRSPWVAPGYMAICVLCSIALFCVLIGGIVLFMKTLREVMQYAVAA